MRAKETQMGYGMKDLLFSLSKENGDFVIETFQSGGKGGQHQNKTSSGVRVHHPESGAVAESREERSQLQNKRVAFRRLLETKTFKNWHRLKTAMALQGIHDMQRELERRVDEMMKPENLRIEVYDPDKELR